MPLKDLKQIVCGQKSMLIFNDEHFETGSFLGVLIKIFFTQYFVCALCTHATTVEDDKKQC